MTQAPRSMQAATRLKLWQGLTVGLMVVGYAGYYLCRSNLSATMPLIIDDLAARGMEPGEVKDRLGWAVSLGTIGYALGKFAAGSLTDLLGGRRNYLIGMAGAVVCTMLFALGGSLPVFTLVWFGNRLIQSLGWPGMIKITSRWFSYSTYGTVMGVISLSFLFGDAAARAFMGRLIDAGLGWRGVFWVAGGVLAVLLGRQRGPDPRVARRARPARAGDEPGQPVRRTRRGPAPRVGRSAAGDAGAQPGVLDRLPAVAGPDALARDVQQLDADLPGGGGRPEQGGGGRHERAVSRSSAGSR